MGIALLTKAMMITPCCTILEDLDLEGRAKALTLNITQIQYALNIFQWLISHHITINHLIWHILHLNTMQYRILIPKNDHQVHHLVEDFNLI